MKKLMTIMGLLLAVAALYSCNNKEDSLPVEQVQGRRFRAVLEQPVEEAATKAYANSDYKLFWNQGDRLSIFYDYTYNREYEFINLDGATAGEFEPVGDEPQNPTDPEITTGYDYAILPYNEQYNQCDPQGTLTVPIPAVQEYYNDPYGIGARPLMVARDKGGVLMFKHVGCYVGVRLKGDGVKVASVSIKGNNSEILAGILKVSFDSDGLPVSEFDPTYSTIASETITMTLSEPVELSNDDYKVFWFNLPEIKFENGLVITVTDVNGGTGQINKSSSLNFERTYFYTTSAKVQITSYPVSSVNVTPSTLSLKPGETATLAAEVLPENAIDKTVTWSSENTEIATVDGNGKVTAVAPGETVITAAAGGKSGTCAVKVNDVITYELKINPEECEIAVGEILDFTYTLTRYVNGEPGDPTQVSNVTLASSDGSIAYVEDDTVEGKAPGTATITATYTPEGADAITATAAVTVKDKYTYSLTLTPATATIKVGESQAYTATLTTVKNGQSSTSTVTPTLTSSNTGVASINGTSVNGVASGTATITASYTPEGAAAVTATANLTVEDSYTYSLAISPATATIKVGGSQAYTATLTTVKNGGTPSTSTVTPTLTSSNTGIASISGTSANGVASGSATITASYTPAGAAAVTATATLTVEDSYTYSLAISPATATIKVGGSQAYTATLTTVKNGGSPTTSTVTPTLTSSNTGVASISGTSVNGVASGTATITASYTPAGAAAVTATATLTVEDSYTYSLAISPATATIKVGGSQVYTATLTTTKNGGTSTTQTVTPTLTSSNTGVASISGTSANGVANGSATITASFTPDGETTPVTADASLTVVDDVTYSVAISPAENAKVAIEKTFKFTLTMTTTTNGTGVDFDVTEAATWTSSNSAFATVSAGTATGVAIGEVTITAKYTTPDGEEHTLTAPLTVTEDPNHAGDPIPIGGEENL